MTKYILTILCVVLLGSSPNSVRAEKDNTKKTYTHPSGKFSFPKYIGDFSRVKVTKFDSTGNDIGFTYESTKTNSLLITVYAFPAPKTRSGANSTLLQHHALEEKNILNKTANSYKIAWPKNIPMWSDEGVPGALTAYNLKLENIGEMTSLLQLYDYGDWRLKFRTTYKVTESKLVPNEINKFHKMFAW